MSPAIQIVETKLAAGETPTTSELELALAAALSELTATSTALQSMGMALSSIVVPRITGTTEEVLAALDKIIAKNVIVKRTGMTH